MTTAQRQLEQRTEGLQALAKRTESMKNNATSMANLADEYYEKTDKKMKEKNSQLV